MLEVVRNLGLPCCLSLAGFGATFYAFGERNRDLGDIGDLKPVALLERGEEGLERRSKTRIIWQGIDPGAALFDGDAIRTPKNMEGSVQLLDSGTNIIIEPDSLIVLETAKDGLQLDLVSGSLLVDQSSAPSSEQKGGAASKAPAPIIKAGGTRLVLSQKDVQLSLSKAEGSDANIAVTKGAVDIQSANQSFKIEQGKTGSLSKQGLVIKQKLEILHPSPNAQLILNQLPERVAMFRWRLPAQASKPNGVAGPMTVVLRTGPARTLLKDEPARAAVASTIVANTTAASGSLDFQLRPGIFFWQLAARDAHGKTVLESDVLRAEAFFLEAPELHQPRDAAAIPLREGKADVTFSWMPSLRAEWMRFELAREHRFAKVLAKQEFKGVNEHQLELREPGKYFWRVSSKLPGISKPLASKAQSFEIRKALSLEPPRLSGPVNDAIIRPQGKKDKPIVLEWDQSEHAETYAVKVFAGDNVLFEKTVSLAEFKLKGLAAGSYRWQVQALAGPASGPASLRSKWSQTQRFHVKRIEALAWLVQPESPHIYHSPKPSLELAWEPGPTGAARWRIRYASKAKDLESAAWRTLERNKALMRHDEDGAYFYEVEALDDKGLASAASPILKVLLASPPSLPAPLLHEDAKLTRASADGTLRLGWKSVPGAKEYKVRIRELANGKTPAKKAKEYPSKKSELRLDRLLPGRYEIALQSVNARDEGGDWGKVKVIEVPKTSNIPPPAIGGIKIK